jgi:hypothetical protein
MNKKWFVFLVLIFSLPVLGNTQIFKNVNFQLNSGAAIPLEAAHFQKYWYPGAHLGASVEVSLNEMLAIKFDAGFNTFIFNHEEWKTDYINSIDQQESDIVINGANRYILEAAVSAKLFPFKKDNHFNPFLTGGGGFVNIRTDNLVIDNIDPEFDVELAPYLSAGFGTEVDYWDEFRFFAQFVYKYAMTKDKNWAEYTYKFSNGYYNARFPLDFKNLFKKQETHFFAVEVGIIFDLAE